MSEPDVISEIDEPRTATRPWWQAFAALFAVGTLVSFLGSWRPSLWTDEAATISAAQRSLTELWAMAHHIDAVHSTYYAFMHLWLAVLPPTPVLLRLPSALAVGLTTVGIYWLGRRLHAGSGALVGSLIFTILPRTSWMGLEARSYAFSALLAVLATLLLVLLAASPGPRRWLLGAGYALVAALAIAVNIYLALLLVSHGLSLLLSRTVSWRVRWTWLAAAVVGVLGASPVVWLTLQQTGQLGDDAFGLVQWASDVVVSQWFLGETPTASRGGGGVVLTGLPGLWKPAAVGLALVCWSVLLAGVLATVRAARGGGDTGVLVWTLPWMVVPTLVIGLYSLGVQNIYNGRYFSYAAPAMALLLGHGLVQLRRRWLRIAAAALIVLLAVPVYASQRTTYAKSSNDWSAVAAFVAANRGPDAGVYFSPRYPIVGNVVGPTARGVQVAYPQAFAGLSDITLLRTPVQDANLSGSSRLLQDSRPQLAAVGQVFVVRRLNYAYTATDDQTMLAAGFVAGRRWAGPLDEVVEFVRT